MRGTGLNTKRHILYTIFGIEKSIDYYKRNLVDGFYYTDDFDGWLKWIKNIELKVVEDKAGW